MYFGHDRPRSSSTCRLSSLNLGCWSPLTLRGRGESCVMVDSLTPAQRSWNMSRIRSVHTKPERRVRSLLHSLGFRFRLHRNDLPGRPDIVLTRYRTAIFVHGCFWHQHRRCKEATTPKSRIPFWTAKLQANVKRDRKRRVELQHQSWNVVVVWECELKDEQRLARRLSTAIHRFSARSGNATP
jgi:DNA mismatch endonuclease (patch repair protein)